MTTSARLAGMLHASPVLGEPDHFLLSRRSDKINAFHTCMSARRILSALITQEEKNHLNNTTQQPEAGGRAGNGSGATVVFPSPDIGAYTRIDMRYMADGAPIGGKGNVSGGSGGVPRMPVNGWVSSGTLVTPTDETYNGGAIAAFNIAHELGMVVYRGGSPA